MGRKSNAQLEKEKKEKEELEKQKLEKESSENKESEKEEEQDIEDPTGEDSEDKITIENFKIKKGISDYIYKGFKFYLKTKDDSEFDLKDLEKKYDDFMNKKI